MRVIIGLVLGFLFTWSARAESTIQVQATWDQPESTAISPWLFGHNTVWSQGGLGIWNEGHHTYNQSIVDLISALHPGVLRFPGGTRAMRYRFEETIGDYALRKPQCDTFTAAYDDTTYGLDEFLRLAEQLGTEVSLVAPWAIGSPARTAAMVAYANASPDSTVVLGTDIYGQDWKTAGYWAALRGLNGHPHSYQVKFVEIGNETYFSIPVGLKKSCDWPFPYKQNFRYVDGQKIPTTAADYTEQLALTGALVRQVDPNILIGAVAQSKYPEASDVTTFESPVDRSQKTGVAWNLELFQSAQDNFDFFILHPDRFGFTNNALNFAATFEIALKAFKQNFPNKKLALTEYGFWFRGHSMLNAIYGADVLRVAIEQGVMMALRHDLIEDDSSSYFGSSGAIQSNGSTSIAYQVMQRLSTQLQPSVIPSASNDPSLSVLTTANSDQKNLSILLIGREPSDQRFLNTTLNLPEGVWTGRLEILSTAKLSDDQLSRTVTAINGQKSVTITLPPHSISILRVSRP